MSNLQRSILGLLFVVFSALLLTRIGEDDPSVELAETEAASNEARWDSQGARLEELERRLDAYRTEVAGLNQKLSDQEEKLTAQARKIIEMERARASGSPGGAAEISATTVSAALPQSTADSVIEAPLKTATAAKIEKPRRRRNQRPNPDSRPTTSKSKSATGDESAEGSTIEKPKPKELARSQEDLLEEIAPARGASILLPKNRLTIDTTFNYTHSSSNRVDLIGLTIIPALTVGIIDIAKNDRDSFGWNLDLRYGLFHNLEVGLSIPANMRWRSTSSRPVNIGTSDEELRSTNGAGLGDIGISLRTQLLEGSITRPFVTGSLTARFPTGRSVYDIRVDENGFSKHEPTGFGFYSIEPGISWLYPTNPMVFFGGLRYGWNIEQNVRSRASTASSRIDPGDRISANLGMVLALNRQSSWSLGYSHSTLLRNRLNGEYSDGSRVAQVGSISTGVSYRFTPKRSVNISVGFGITNDAPDANLTVRIPFYLDDPISSLRELSRVSTAN